MNTALENLFTWMNQSGVAYFLLTDFDSDLRSKDIDLFIHPDSRLSFEKILFSLGWYKRREPAHHINHHFYFSLQSDIFLDVKYELSFASDPNNCSTYLNVAGALDNGFLNSKGIKRPAYLDALLLYTAHLAYKERGQLELKHRLYLNKYLTQLEAADQPLPHVVFQLKQSLNKNAMLDTAELQNIIHAFFQHDKKRMVRKRKKYNVGWGAKILFLGTDGAGKTTLIKAVKEKLVLKSRQLYLGTGEGGWTSPTMKKFLHFKSNNRIINKAFSVTKSYILLPLEFLLRIIPIKVKSKYSVVLIDRLPGSIFLEKNSGKKRLYQSILPKPDLVFFLYADPHILQQRKPGEVTTERSEADIKKFRNVAEKVSSGNYVSIDTSHLTIDEARDIILAEIYKNGKVYDNLLTAKLN